MRNNRLVSCGLAIWVGLSINLKSRAADAPSSEGIKFKFPIGLSYIDGAYDIDNKLKQSITFTGTHTVSDDFVLPVGLTLNPRIEFPFGLGIGLALGPFEFLSVSENGDFSNSELSYIIPVGAYLQYNLFRDSAISPFVRVGVRYPITGGSMIKNGELGFFGSAGVEFFRNKKVSFGVEAGYDTSRVTVNANFGAPDMKATPIGFNVGIFVMF